MTLQHGVPLTRRKLLEAAWAMRSTDKLLEAIRRAPSASDLRVFTMLHEWTVHGAQSVVMPETYAAALMATDAHEALDGQELPWPAFEVRLPPGLLFSSLGEVSSVFAMRIPSYIKLANGQADHEICLCYCDPVSWGDSSYRSLAEMFEPETKVRVGTMSHGFISDEFAALHDESQERRLWSMLCRVVAGVTLAMVAEKGAKPSGGRLEPREKHGALKPNSIQLGRPLRIDCRASIRGFVMGHSRARGPQTVQTLVRGHWRQQAYGPNHTLRRTTWIQPHFRGEGPLLVRPTQLGFKEHE